MTHLGRAMVALLVTVIFLGISGARLAFADTGRGAPKVLMLGDSMLATNRGSRQSVGHALSRELGARVNDRSRPGARYFYSLPLSGSMGMRIPAQVPEGRYDWVVLNGGGNDLMFGCGCGKCAGVMDRLITANGRQGAIPDLVSRLRASGARVLVVGYLRSPGVGSVIEGCRDDGDELDRRITELARLDKGIDFLPMSDLVPPGDRSFHQADMIHPSQKGSAEIGRRIAAFIRKAGV